MTVETGHFAVLRRAFNRVSDDQRIQAVIIAFCFGALLEALAGFGTPVAITAVMLIARRLRADQGRRRRARRQHRAGRLRRDRDPDRDAVARSPSLPKDDLGAMVGRQTPLLALIVPLILVGMVDGRRGIRQAWPAAVVGGFVVRHRPVRVLELRLRRADRHRRLAARPPARSSPPAAGLAALRAAARRGQGGGSQPAIAGAAVADAGHEPEVARKEGNGRDSDGARSSPPSRPTSSSSRLLDRPVGADQGLPRRAHEGVRVAGARTSQPQRRAADVGDLQAQLGQRGRHAAARRRAC